MEKWIIMQRIGYGSNFNHIMFNEKRTIIKKQAYTEYGIKKLHSEMQFYEFIRDKNIKFLIPKIFEYNDDYVIMEYINAQPYTYDIELLSSLLNILHNSASIHISKEDFAHHLHEETISKITKRLKCVNTNISNTNASISKVNNQKLYSIQFIIDSLKTFFTTYIDNLTEYKFCPIHGDPQYNNIIYDGNNMYFIDPKGYFGDMEIYGMKEYDIAKLYFSASGYDVFDNMVVDNLEIQNNEIYIDFIKPQIGLEKEEKITIAFFITIWLSNCHIFKSKAKVLLSHYIALYFASYYMDAICL